MPNLDRKSKRTIISLEELQPELDFQEAEHSLPFMLPEYQRGLLTSRLAAGIMDFAIVALIYCIFLIVTFFEMSGFSLDRSTLGIFGLGFLLLVAVYFFLFMLSASQTPGMKHRGLVVVTRDDSPLDLQRACVRGFGYLISILPLMLGFVWALIDPEHVTWADKVSGTYMKKVQSDLPS